MPSIHSNRAIDHHSEPGLEHWWIGVEIAVPYIYNSYMSKYLTINLQI